MLWRSNSEPALATKHRCITLVDRPEMEPQGSARGCCRMAPVRISRRRILHLPETRPFKHSNGTTSRCQYGVSIGFLHNVELKGYQFSCKGNTSLQSLVRHLLFGAQKGPQEKNHR